MDGDAGHLFEKVSLQKLVTSGGTVGDTGGSTGGILEQLGGNAFEDLAQGLSIGFGKAAKFIDNMEDLGIVSGPNGQKPRDVLITKDEWHEKLSRVSLD